MENVAGNGGERLIFACFNINSLSFSGDDGKNMRWGAKSLVSGFIPSAAPERPFGLIVDGAQVSMHLLGDGSHMRYSFVAHLPPEMGDMLTGAWPNKQMESKLLHISLGALNALASLDMEFLLARGLREDANKFLFSVGTFQNDILNFGLKGSRIVGAVPHGWAGGLADRDMKRDVIVTLMRELNLQSKPQPRMTTYSPAGQVKISRN